MIFQSAKTIFGLNIILKIIAYCKSKFPFKRDDNQFSKEKHNTLS